MFAHWSKITWSSISLIVLLALLAASVSPASAVTVGNDEINFIGVRYNYPNPGESTWYYQVISGSQPAISHVTWELNTTCVSLVDAGSWDGVNLDNRNPGGGDPESVNPDPTTGITGIKFDQGFADGETRYYYFTVDGNWVVDNNVVVASKGGPGYDTAEIAGPSGDCTPLGNPSLDLEKLVNDADADEAPGISVTEGDALSFEFKVTNTGQTPLANILVTDNIFGEICTIASLAVGASESCFKDSTAALGEHTNIAVASTTYNNEMVQDSDPANYTASPRFIPSPGIDIEKYVNGDDADDAPGPELIEGAPVTFFFSVQNTGNVDLSNVTVVDDVFGPICSFATLPAGLGGDCSIDAFAGLGLHTNIAAASGEYNGAGVSDSDPANYTGVPRFIPNPGLDLEKLVNGEDADTPTGPEAPVGSIVTFEYIVTNTGNVTLTNIEVGDDQLGRICLILSLDPGQSETCTATAEAIAGQYYNQGKARTEYNGEVVNDFDDGHYFGVKPFTPTPGIDIEKYVNGKDADSAASAPSLPVGSTATFTYIVTNTGNVTLTNIQVGDNILGKICVIPSLAPGASFTCTKASTVISGAYSNIAKAVGWYGDPKTNGVKASDTDWAHYLGVVKP